MPRKPTPRPTDTELAILRLLWEHGPSTVRQVHARLGEVGYTTVLKMLQIMTEKGLVQRDESRRAHVYAACTSRERTQGQLVRDLLDRAFEGSAAQLVMRALSAKGASEEEITEIRRLLDDMSPDRQTEEKEER